MDDQEVGSNSKENMTHYLSDLQRGIDAGNIDGIFTVAQRADGAFETSFVGKIDPFSVFGFSIFVQMKKLMEMLPVSRDQSEDNQSNVVQ